MRRWWLVISLGVLVLLLAVWSGYRYYLANVKVEPEVLLGQAMERTLAASSYRYRVEARLVTGGQSKLLSRVTGERNAEGNFHVWGEQAGDTVEVYQVGDTTYLLDAKNGKWMTVAGNDLGRQKSLMAEIDPLANLSFQSTGAITNMGKQKGEPGKPVLLKFKPEMSSDFMNAWFTDFNCSLWIDRGACRVKKAVIEAQSKTSPNTRAIFTIHMDDFGGKYKIVPPA